MLATAQPDEAPDSAPAAAGDVAATPEPSPEPLADGDIRLTLAFNGDCWTEISDANGRRLFFGMGRSGRDVELTGPAPFDVLLGNADNVAVRVNDNPFTIPAAARNNRTARLTILEP